VEYGKPCGEKINKGDIGLQQNREEDSQTKKKYIYALESSTLQEW
jgi:hypothetical protein